MTGSGTRGRPWFLVVLSVGSLLLTVGAFYAGQQVRSPEQQAAEAAPPDETVLTAVVEERVVGETVSLSGTVGAEQGIEVTAAAGEGAGKLVVSGVNTEAGAEVAAGAVPVEVSGRPVFALEGAIPAYRDLGPGDEGEDVSQLQEALRGLGYEIWDAEGHYGAATKSAVERMYEEAGFDPAERSAESAAQLAEAEQAVEDAEAALQDAQAAEGEPVEGAPDTAELEDRLEDAEDALADIQARTGASLPMSEVVFVPRLPAQVVALPVQEAAEVAGGDRLLTLAGGPMVARAVVQPIQADSLTEGMAAVLTLGDEQIDGEVLRLREIAAEQEGQADQTEVVVSSDLPDAWVGQSVRIDVQVSTTGDPVPAVPVTALHESADGATSVIKMDNGVETEVEVEAGLVGGGYVEIVSGDLRPGDEVVVGTS